MARIPSASTAATRRATADGGDGLNTAYYTFNAFQKEKQHDFVFRIDHTFDAKNTVFARVAWGEQDRVLPLAYGKAYAESIPGARFVTYPTGHAAALEQPAALARDALSFLKEGL